MKIIELKKKYLVIVCLLTYAVNPTCNSSIPNKLIFTQHGECPRTVPIVIVGAGNIGKELTRQILEQKKHLKNQFNTDLKICGLFRSLEGIANANGLSQKEINQIINQKNTIKLNETEVTHLKNQIVSNQLQIISELTAPFILVDTTATDQTYPLYIKTLERGGYVVTANKKTLAGSQEDFNTLFNLGKNHIFYSATVGAGLPIVSTLKRRLLAHDEVLEIKGLLSGTLGYIFSRLEDGLSFSQAAMETYNKGYFEPHPKEDLSGKDAARKVLILARTMGLRLEFSDIRLTPLYPPEMENLDVQEFLEKIPTLDEFYKNKLADAKKRNRILRYVASITNKPGNHLLSVDIEAIDPSSPLYALKGPENMAMYRTKIYNQNPLAVHGPGAGIEITAGSVFADICEILNGL